VVIVAGQIQWVKTQRAATIYQTFRDVSRWWRHARAPRRGGCLDFRRCRPTARSRARQHPSRRVGILVPRCRQFRGSGPRRLSGCLPAIRARLFPEYDDRRREKPT